MNIAGTFETLHRLFNAKLDVEQIPKCTFTQGYTPLLWGLFRNIWNLTPHISEDKTEQRTPANGPIKRMG